MFAKLFVWSLALVPWVNAAPHEAKRATAVPPKQDPFYNSPSIATLESLQPGAIVRSRKTPGPLGGVEQYTTSNVQASYQILYRTTSSVGQPAAAACLVIVPHNADFTKLLAYEAAYDSADENCSPSYTLQKSSNDTSYDPLFMAAALNQGWVVVTADYEGLDAAFVAGLGSGRAVLDSIRATLRSTTLTGVSKDSKYALWGYSGGALASEWALEQQASYAPELHFIGAALGGLTPNATSVLLSINGGLFSGLAFNGINGLMAAYSNLTSFVNRHLIPSKAAEFRSVTTACGNSSAPNLAFQNLTAYFDQGLATLDYPVPQSVLKYGATMGIHGVPRPPVYAYKAIGDEISKVADTDALVAKYCSKGAHIEYVRNEVGEHVTEAVLGSGGAFAFLKDRFQGVAASSKCSTTNVVVTDLSPQTIEAFGDEIAGVLAVILSRPLGPNSPIGI